MKRKNKGHTMKKYQAYNFLLTINPGNGDALNECDKQNNHTTRIKMEELKHV